MAKKNQPNTDAANQWEEGTAPAETAEEASARNAAIARAWTVAPGSVLEDNTVEPGTTKKAKDVKHAIRKDKVATAHEKTLGAEGDILEVYVGQPIDLAPLWAQTDISVLRSYAAQAILLDAGEQYKAQFLAGKIQANDPEAMAAIVEKIVTTHATMRGITQAPSSPKGPNVGKVKKADAILEVTKRFQEAKAAGDMEAAMACMDELQALNA